VPLLAVHDGIVVECGEDCAEEIEVWLERAMVDGMEAVLSSPGAQGPSVPVEVETKIGRTWAG
jgi:DNA polymerase I-like protein with 3'-5' exonuclease and polymerase domains